MRMLMRHSLIRHDIHVSILFCRFIFFYYVHTTCISLWHVRDDACLPLFGSVLFSFKSISLYAAGLPHFTTNSSLSVNQRSLMHLISHKSVLMRRHLLLMTSHLVTSITEWRHSDITINARITSAKRVECILTLGCYRQSSTIVGSSPLF